MGDDGHRESTPRFRPALDARDGPGGRPIMGIAGAAMPYRKLRDAQTEVALGVRRRRVGVGKGSVARERGVRDDGPGGDRRGRIGGGPNAQRISRGASGGENEAVIGQLCDARKAGREYDAEDGATAARTVLRGGAVQISVRPKGKRCGRVRAIRSLK